MEHIWGDKLEEVLSSPEPKLFLWKQVNPNTHTALDNPSCGYIRTVANEYTCTFTHMDDHISDWLDVRIRNCFTFGLKELWNMGFSPVQCVDLGYYIDPPENPYLHDIYLNMLGVGQPLNNIIPLTKHVEVWSSFEFDLEWWWERAQDDIGQTPHTLWHVYAPRLFSQIEKQGIKVDIPTFMKHYPNKENLISQSGLVYSHYNFYTTTGRPSNAFGGVNFAAINKHDGSRDAFVSENGVLVNVDFKSYHLQLLSKVMEFDLPDDPHTSLGQQYFETDHLSQEQYDEAKRITFRNLYSQELDDMVKDVPFFNKTKEFSRELYESYLEEGKMYSRFGRMFTFDNELSENKVFNYFVQSLETEVNLIQLAQLLMDRCPVPILYTYDSFTFDIPEYQLESLKECLEKHFRFPYDITVGTTLGF